ncbi:hypothetical protein BJI69_13735 [Luteibacter rhizovicinus DSM 16549]|uniref:Uncharacterized protein n=1 Tax=Luteibacter rhizovicinus DSM 16549 TaxID=1440763 RepID=A0A0G9HGC7_9GAMM|nr:hypothetical protein [Luteibacter rhizovicinus]APG04848.1 hypothetical protein BJI69_13735 [Luteibacter rhizovicinus DSM 16549]KLD68541.1 hypothetical protein Y883_02445 [Luteibacter rhizovicinus DSM 16549]KLD74371.1 hypothetical protein Y886_33030 [Xanthomonas hyacinthi DSM 19077]
MRASSGWVIAVALAVTACSHHEPDTSSVGAATAASAPPVHSAAPSTGAPTVTAAERPFDTYLKPDSDGLQWVAIYYAVSSGPVDYSAMAGRLDPAYQKATDAFVRKDALTAFQGRLDQAIATAKASPYVQLPPVMTRMPGYDVDHARYDFTDLIGADHGMHVAEGAASVRFAASPALTMYAPATETAARDLEHTLSTNPLSRQILLTVYGKVVGGTLMGGTPQLTVVPSRVVIENTYADGHTTPLLTATVP